MEVDGWIDFARLAFPETCLLLSPSSFSSPRTLHLSPKDIAGGRRRFLLLPQAEVRIQSPLSFELVESVCPGLEVTFPLQRLKARLVLGL